MTSIFGYFDRPDQVLPAYDPGLDVECPFCRNKLDSEYLSHSVMPLQSDRSYFFRYCKKHADEPEFHRWRDDFDDTLIDALAKTQDFN